LLKANNKSELGITNLPATTKLVQGNEVTAVYENSVWQTSVSYMSLTVHDFSHLKNLFAP